MIQDNEQELKDEAERLRLIEVEEETRRRQTMNKVSDIQLTNKLVTDENIF